MNVPVVPKANMVDTLPIIKDVLVYPHRETVLREEFAYMPHKVALDIAEDTIEDMQKRIRARPVKLMAITTIR